MGQARRLGEEGGAFLGASGAKSFGYATRCSPVGGSPQIWRSRR
jgi:hypothetical protein